MNESNPALEKIKEYIEKNNVVLFMKVTPDFPQSGFSSAVSKTLKGL